MPKLKIEKVISFSSEDSVHVANNLLSNDSAKKWKCNATGEKSASIVLQLDKASIITSIDIGNENSAYVEVLVSRSSSNDEYKVLLVMSSFMTPLEARQSTNINKVRMFTNDQLSKPENSEKWDRVKVVCTQPFNRHVQYGLSFITLHSPEGKADNPITPLNLGKYTLRPCSPDNLSIGSLFARRKEVNDDTPVKAAVAIREASAFPSKINKRPSMCKAKLTELQNTPTLKKQINIEDQSTQPRNRDELLYNNDEETPNAKIEKLIEKKNEEIQLKQSLKEKELQSLKEKAKKTSTETKAKESHKQKPSAFAGDPGTSDSNKRKIDMHENAKKKQKIERPMKPFNELLKGVVFVISGIQNPDRANLRTNGLQMGAKYKPDWDNSCTHLICAFANTPKFNQVRGKGKIITKKWIEECHQQRKKLPWRRFALDKSDKNKDESEDEIWELIEEAVPSPVSHNDANVLSGSDTEDEIDRIQASQKKQNSVYDNETDTESVELTSTKDIAKLPKFLSGKRLYIDKNLSEEEKLLLVKYITAYNGILLDDIEGTSDVIISSPLCGNALKKLHPNDVFVSPEWIWKCHNEQRLVSSENFEL